MIRVPPSWSCASYECALVELDEAVYLCRIIVAHGIVNRYTFESTVRLEAPQASRLRSQDCSPVSEHTVQWCTSHSSRGARGFTVTLNDEGVATTTAADSTLRISCPRYTYVAKSVTLSGPRLDTRATPSNLSAALTGCFVLPGAHVRTEDAVYRVDAVAMKDGHLGVALVSGQCRVLLNAGRLTDSAKDAAPPLLGMEKERAELGAVLRMAAAVPGTVVGVIVRGPSGCGGSSLVRHCLAACPSTVTLSWSSAFSVETAWQQTHHARLVVLLIHPAESVFGAEERELASMALRKLQHDAHVLTQDRNGTRVSVVAIAMSHYYSSACASDVMEAFFTVSITYTMPDATLRAALLAHVRGGRPEDWRDAAQSLVGKTCAETLDLAQHRNWQYTPPFRPVRWADIGGLDDVKERLHRALVWPQQRPEAFARFGLTPPKGVLLFGPPGCAKTTLVKALCSEGYFSLIYLDSASVISAYVGESERQLRDVFARAARQAPCIVFFDEVEVLGAKRESGGRDVEQVRLLSTLLTELDGFAAASGVCFVGATNVPQLIDPALLRPGRFDYLVYVPLPHHGDREKILALLLAKTATDVGTVATATEGFSGADLHALCSAALLELMESSSEGPPASLQDATVMTSFLLERARRFKRTSYNSTAMEAFQREYATAV